MTATPAGSGVTMHLGHALVGLDQALDAPRRAGIPLGNWRWVVRQRMVTLRDVLSQESGTSDDGWLAARGGAAFRERNLLLTRLGTLGAEVLETPDVERTRLELKRLLVDITHHLQRRRDIAYDEVAMELGGSE